MIFLVISLIFTKEEGGDVTDPVRPMKDAIDLAAEGVGDVEDV